MKKRFIPLIAIAAFLLILSSCSMAGVEMGLAGNWTATKYLILDVDFSEICKVEVEIGMDDSFKLKETPHILGIPTGPTTTESGKITSADSAAKTFTVKNDSDGSETVYSYELNSDTLKLTYKDGTRVLELKK